MLLQIVILQSAFNNFITDYDSSEEHCSPGPNITGHILTNNSKNWGSFANRAVLSLVGGNSKWDAVYFLDIAQNGYQYEQNMAFFPLLPLLVRSLGTLLKPIQICLSLSQKTTLTFAGTVINMTAFPMAAVGLFCLTKSVFCNQKLAYRTSIFFCFNPASVFFSAAYSESVFAMTLFWGVFCLEQKPSRYLSAAFLFALGSGARSNGIVSIGFIGYRMLSEIYQSCQKLKVATCSCWVLLGMLLLKTFHMLLLVCIVGLPFVAFQYYGFVQFCGSAENSPWCDSYLSLPYSYIQKHYWNVGFFKYYEFKQLPNFFLAMPIVLIGALGILDYLKNQTWNDILSLGLASSTACFHRAYSASRFVYAVHLGFLLVFGVTSMHVQVRVKLILIMRLLIQSNDYNYIYINLSCTHYLSGCHPFCRVIFSHDLLDCCKLDYAAKM